MFCPAHEDDTREKGSGDVALCVEGGEDEHDSWARQEARVRNISTKMRG